MSVVDDEASMVTSLLQVSRDANNLFVQLTPDILAMLSAACNFDVIIDREIRSDGLSVSWNLKDDHSKSFLPLEIFLHDQILYASFNGGILEEMEGKLTPCTLMVCVEFWVCDESVFYVFSEQFM